jgi:hypothetical protein
MKGSTVDCSYVHAAGKEPKKGPVELNCGFTPPKELVSPAPAASDPQPDPAAEENPEPTTLTKGKGRAARA